MILEIFSDLHKIILEVDGIDYYEVQPTMAFSSLGLQDVGPLIVLRCNFANTNSMGSPSSSQFLNVSPGLGLGPSPSVISRIHSGSRLK